MQSQGKEIEGRTEVVGINTVGSSNLGTDKIIDCWHDLSNKMPRITRYVLHLKASILAEWKKKSNKIKLDNLTVAGGIKVTKKLWLVYEHASIVNKEHISKGTDLLFYCVNI